MQKFYQFFLRLSFGLIILTNCSPDGKKNANKQKLQIPAHEEKLQHYYAENQRGKWADLEQEHTPLVITKKNKKEFLITVTSPFPSRPDHYTEIILLADYSVKEIDKKTFLRSVPEQASAVFTLPVAAKGEYYIMLKCNLHDMWFKKIILN